MRLPTNQCEICVTNLYEELTNNKLGVSQL